MMGQSWKLENLGDGSGARGGSEVCMEGTRSFGLIDIGVPFLIC
jgi:hypothetical protein